MPQYTDDPQLPTKDQSDSSENKESGTNSERFESDTQRIIHRHLENKDDIITDEDIANVRVGMTPPHLDGPTEARFEDEGSTNEVEEEYLGDNEEIREEKTSGKDQLTPWDTIEED